MKEEDVINGSGACGVEITDLDGDVGADLDSDEITDRMVQ